MMNRKQNSSFIRTIDGRPLDISLQSRGKMSKTVCLGPVSVDTPAVGLIRLPLKKEGELALPAVPGTEITDIWNIVKPK